MRWWSWQQFLLGLWHAVLLLGGSVFLLGLGLALRRAPWPVSAAGNWLVGQYEAAWNAWFSGFRWALDPLGDFIEWLIGYQQGKVLKPVHTAFNSLWRAIWRISHVQIPKAVTYCLQTVNRWAVSGWKRCGPGRAGHTRQASLAFDTTDEVVKALVGRLVSLAVDVGDLDAPEVAVPLQLVLRELAAHSGPGAAAAGWLTSLLTGAAGQGTPGGLAEVIANINCRLGAVEAQWSQFYADGGGEILQAGDGWKQLDSLAVDAGLLGFAASAIADPAGTASALAGLTEVAGTRTIASIARLAGSPGGDLAQLFAGLGL